MKLSRWNEKLPLNRFHLLYNLHCTLSMTPPRVVKDVERVVSERTGSMIERSRKRNSILDLKNISNEVK